MCTFCSIAAGALEAPIVLDDEQVLAFLDHRPVFPGHVLVVPREHYETLADLPPDLLEPLFSRVQRVARAVEAGLGADGTFVAMNNKVSQSVPHVHAHVVPRRRKDGLRGFFWPRTKYSSAEEVERYRSTIAAALEGSGPSTGSERIAPEDETAAGGKGT